MIPPYNDSQAWSKIYIDGMWSPGLITLSGHERATKGDVKQADGQKGATMTRKGVQAGEFEADHYLSSEEEWDQWDAYQAMLEQSNTTKPPKGLAVFHPDLARNHYTSVVTASIGEVRLDGLGGGSIKVKFQEHCPPVKVAPSNASAKPDPNDPIVKATQELKDALAEGEDL